MQEINLISLIEDYGVELAAGGLIACAAAIIMRNALKISAKVCLLVAFAVGAAITFLLEFFVFALPAEDSVSKAISAGSLAVVITSFTKKIAFMDKNDVKSNLEKLLSSIVLSDELDKVVDEIVDRIKTDATFSEQKLKDVLRENVDADIDDDTLNMVSGFILKALSDGK
ncbi:MAG: hypothetical protein ILP02_04730 [Clostridia bacterium]|nr:hypothetical protein [Clostridia bacterium]